jgi:ferredoxin
MENTISLLDRREGTVKKMRRIIEIEEDKCTGCGQCIIACAEGALALIEGKARLVGDIYCDGLGACIGECPEGALNIIEREADDFDTATVEHTHASPVTKPRFGTLPCGCPSSAMLSLKKTSPSPPESHSQEIASKLIHWPVKLQLLSPHAPFLKDADLLLLADCVAVAHPNLHQEILNGKAVAIGCPKLDDLEAHIERLAEILKGAKPRSLTVIHMEVPCCSAFMHAAQEAIARSGIDAPLHRMVISRTGSVIHKE